MGDLSELRIVLLGCRGAGKSSTGNTIIGKEEFDLKRSPACVTRHGQAPGRNITVVEAPGWWSTYPLKDLASISKQEIELSASVCSPGPHAFLLVIRVDTPFTEVHRVAAKEHLSLFGLNIWHHTIVLFTHGDHLGDITIEQHIEREGKALQWVVQACCKRYQVFNNLEKDNDIQVAKVLNQIEEMVAKSRYYYGMCQGTLQRKERRMEEKERAVKRRRLTVEQWQDLRCQIGDTHFISHLRIVLLGNRAAGKSSAGNTILGKEVFALKRSAECVKREGEISGRHVTLIEAPGWWKNFCVEHTPALNKQEVVNSVSMCSPWPHAVLLIIRLDTPFTETHRMVAKQQLELLGETMWSSTIVLFTCGDWLGDTTIEEHIESEGLALQWVIEKCGNRYHVVDNCNRGSSAQVTELLGKIEDMAAGHKNHCHVTDMEISQTNEDNSKAAEVMEQGGKAALKPMLAHASNPLPKELRVILLGHRASGKTSVVNIILGREKFDTSETTHRCVMGQGSVAGRQITLVDTPGWWSNYLLKNTPKSVLEEIVRSTCLCPPGPNAILLVIRVDCAFQTKSQTALQQHLGLLCEGVWRHTLVLFMYGEWLGDTSIEKHIASEGEALKWVVEKCGYRYHVFHKDRTDTTQVTELLEKIEDLVEANCGCYYETDIQILMQMMEETYMRAHSLDLGITNILDTDIKLQYLPKMSQSMDFPPEMKSDPQEVKHMHLKRWKVLDTDIKLQNPQKMSQSMDFPPEMKSDPQEVKHMHLKRQKVLDSDIKLQNPPKMSQSMDFPPEMRGEDELDTAYASLTASSLPVSDCGSRAHSSAASLQSSGFCSLPNSLGNSTS